MKRRRISSGDPWESVWGYSRAVVADRHVFVSGTADEEPPGDSYGQARRCLERVMNALAEAGGGAEHIVRTRIYLTRDADVDAVARAHVEVFGDARPAATAVVVQALVDPRYLVEIEAEAVLDD